MISAVCKAIMDTLQFHYEQSIFANDKSEFWNPLISWKNKWKNGDKLQGEKFLFSSTIFVWTTDAWHFFQSIMLTSFFLALVIALFFTPAYPLTFINVFLFTLIFKVTFSLTFELFFSIILLKK